MAEEASVCGIKWPCLLLRSPGVVLGTSEELGSFWSRGSECLRSCELVVVVIGHRWALWCGETARGVEDSDPWRSRLWPCGAVVGACPLLRLHGKMLLALLLLWMREVATTRMKDWRLFIGDWSLNLLQRSWPMRIRCGMGRCSGRLGFSALLKISPLAAGYDCAAHKAYKRWCFSGSKGVARFSSLSGGDDGEMGVAAAVWLSWIWCSSVSCVDVLVSTVCLLVMFSLT